MFLVHLFFNVDRHRFVVLKLTVVVLLAGFPRNGDKRFLHFLGQVAETLAREHIIEVLLLLLRDFGLRHFPNLI